GAYEVASDAQCGYIVEPDLALFKFQSRDVSPSNNGRYVERALDELYTKQSRATDPTVRRRYIRELERRLFDEEVHYIPTLQWHRIIVQSARVKGWTITPSHYLNNQLDTVWLTEQARGGPGPADAPAPAARPLMWKYLLKRFLLMFPTLVGVAVVTFLLIRVIPGDVVELRLAGDRGAASQAAIDAERVRFGLDQPVWKQFATWMVGVARLDFGTSMWTGSPIWDEIKLRFALSLQVAIMATLVAVTLAVPLGLLAALRQDSWIDYAVRIFS